jgi:hypothetical protein
MDRRNLLITHIKGGQKKHFKDSLKVSLKSLSIDVNSWETLAQNRQEWRCSITSGVRLAEERRKPEAQVKRVIRKNTETRTQAINTDHLWQSLSCQDRTC